MSNILEWNNPDKLFLEWLKTQKQLNSILHINGYHSFGKTELLLRWAQLCKKNNLGTPVFIDGREIEKPDHLNSLIKQRLPHYSDLWERDKNWPSGVPNIILFIDNADRRITTRIKLLNLPHIEFPFHVVQSTLDMKRNRDRDRMIIPFRDWEVYSVQLPNWTGDDFIRELDEELSKLPMRQTRIIKKYLDMMWGSRFWFEISWPSIKNIISKGNKYINEVILHEEINSIIKENYLAIESLLGSLSPTEYQLLQYFAKFQFEFKLGSFSSSFFTEAETVHSQKFLLVKKGLFSTNKAKVSIQPFIYRWFREEGRRHAKYNVKSAQNIDSNIESSETLKLAFNKNLAEENFDTPLEFRNIDNFLESSDQKIIFDLKKIAPLSDIPVLLIRISEKLIVSSSDSNDYQKRSMLLDASERFARLALEMAMENEDFMLIGKSAQQLGHSLWYKEDYSTSYEYWTTAYIQFENISPKDSSILFEEAYSLYLMAHYQDKIGEEHVANELYIRCLKIPGIQTDKYFEEIKFSIEESIDRIARKNI